jgi:hypothetical protein
LTATVATGDGHTLVIRTSDGTVTTGALILARTENIAIFY